MEIFVDKNIFNSNTQTIVNPVNTEGVMGAGLALQFKQRYPEMFEIYKKICQNNHFKIGQLWMYKSKDKWIINFPTKISWKNPTKEEYLEAGLRHFLEIYKKKEITSISFPLLGAGLGGLNPVRSFMIMYFYLNDTDIPCNIYMTSKQKEYIEKTTNKKL